jgi:hypothetical protein
MMIDKRRQYNLLKRSEDYVEIDFVWLQLARAFYSPQNYLQGGPTCQS